MRTAIQWVLSLAVLALLNGCAMEKLSWPLQQLGVAETEAEKAEKTPETQPETELSSDLEGIDDIYEAELTASKEGREILATGRNLALEERAVIRGSCWDWINAVYKRAGFGEMNHVVFKSKKRGPYVDHGKIESGDWLYYVNHSYKRVGHSGIFVHWVDRKKKIGMVLSYAGEGRRKPGRYKAYNLKDVYFVKRPGFPSEEKRTSEHHSKLAAAGSN